MEVFARSGRPAFAQRLEKPAGIFAIVFLVLTIIAAVAREKDLAHQFAVAGPAAVTLNILTMVLGYSAGWAFGLPKPQRIAMPAVVYSLFMFATGGVMIAIFGRRRSRVEAAANRGLSWWVRILFWRGGRR